MPGCTGFYYGEDGEDDQVPAEYASGPKTGFLENFSASFAATQQAGRTDSREISLRDAYDPITDVLNAHLRKATGLTMISPDADKFYRNPYRGRAQNGFFDATGGIPEDERRIWEEISRRRRGDPKFMSEMGQTPQEFHARIDEKAKRSLETETDVSERSTTLGTVGGFTGSLFSGLTDPVNVVTMMLGAGPSKTILGTIGKEAGLNAGIEALTLPFVAKRRSDIGAPMTMGDAIESVLVAGAAGGVVGGVIHGGSNIAKRYRGRSIDSLTDTDVANLIIDPAKLTPEQRSALDLVGEAAYIDRTKPFGDSPQGVARHHETLEAATVAITQDTLPEGNTAPPARVNAEEQLSRFDTPAGEGQQAQIAALTHDIQAALAAPPPQPVAIVPQTAEQSPRPTKRGTYTADVIRAEGTGKNPQSSAYGVGQFLESTWLSLYKRTYGAGGLTDAEILAKRTNPALGARMTQLYADENGRFLRKQGLDDTEGNRSLAHFLGAGDAAKVLHAAPDTPIARLVRPAAIAANKSVLQGKTAGQVVDWAHRRIGEQPRPRPTVALSEEVVDGEAMPVVRELHEVMDEHDADDAFIKSIEECLL